MNIGVPEAGVVTVSGGPGSVEPYARVTISNPRTGEPVTVTAESDGSFSTMIAAETGDVLHIESADAAGNHGGSRPFTVPAPDGDLPPDPATVAPPLDETEITLLHEATAFLYTGANPIQIGVAEGRIEPRRAAVVRGQVLSRDNRPLSGVTVAIKDHPEFGETRSRADGRFDMAVNGGGLLTLNYEKPGHLPVQRQVQAPVQAPWQDFVQAGDVVMVALDPRVIAIDLSTSTPMQVAQGSATTDADGQRQATVLFPQGTTATMTLPDGTTQPLSILHVRATEYTVGANGPKAMPGPLPPSSGYTYAVELSVDEAIAAGAKRVDFSQPLPVYVDNFLGFPVGGVVPVGWYDREKAAWIPANNGRIIRLLGVADGLAQLDTDGSGNTAGAPHLAQLGITDAERARLAQLYPSGRTLWRVVVSHFTPWDCNWPYGPPEDAEEPPPPEEDDPPPDDDSDECAGCSINAQAQTLGEEIPVTGTPYTLHYQSRRAEGHKPDRVIDIRVSGATVPASLKGIDLSVIVSGKTFTRTFPPDPNQAHHFEWDGLDAYGRPVTGASLASVIVSYRYHAVYYPARADFEQSFAVASSAAGTTIIGRRGASTLAVGRSWQESLSAGVPSAQSLGAWSLGVHHAYDPVRGVLHRGGGERHSADGISMTITTVAGNGDLGYAGDGGPATQARLSSPTAIALAGDGSFYVADTDNDRIRRVGPDGRITTVAGNGFRRYAGDGGPATQASLSLPFGIAQGDDGTLYIADSGNHRIRRVGPDGRITTVAGTGTAGYAGDGTPATHAHLSFPYGIAVGCDGSLYIADSRNHRIRRVGADGRITTVAGNGFGGYAGDGGLATQARLDYPIGIAVGGDGSVYIADAENDRIRRVGPDGRITTVAGNGVISGDVGDGSLATQARLHYPRGIAVGDDGSLYIADAGNNRIRRVGPDGRITTVAGDGHFSVREGYVGDGALATQASFSYLYGIALGGDGSLYIADGGHARIRRVSSLLSGFSARDIAIPSADGREMYKFDATGRHLETVSALTQAVLYASSTTARGV